MTRTRLTYPGGAGGVGDPTATLTDCPCCGQAVRVDLHGDRLVACCFGGCEPEQLLEALAVPALAAELARAAR